MKKHEIFDSRSQVKVRRIKSSESSVSFHMAARVAGDFRISFFTDEKHMFHFWLNTNMLDGDNVVLKKSDLDRAVKDTSDKRFDADFSVQLSYRDDDIIRDIAEDSSEPAVVHIPTEVNDEENYDIDREDEDRKLKSLSKQLKKTLQGYIKLYSEVSGGKLPRPSGALKRCLLENKIYIEGVDWGLNNGSIQRSNILSVDDSQKRLPKEKCTSEKLEKLGAPRVQENPSLDNNVVHVHHESQDSHSDSNPAHTSCCRECCCSCTRHYRDTEVFHQLSLESQQSLMNSLSTNLKTSVEEKHHDQSATDTMPSSVSDYDVDSESDDEHKFLSPTQVGERKCGSISCDDDMWLCKEEMKDASSVPVPKSGERIPDSISTGGVSSNCSGSEDDCTYFEEAITSDVPSDYSGSADGDVSDEDAISFDRNFLRLTGPRRALHLGEEIKNRIQSLSLYAENIGVSDDSYSGDGNADS